MDDIFKKQLEDALPDAAEEAAAQAAEVPTTIKLGEKEYTQDDLAQLVGLGESARQLESQWSTKLDKLMPAYTKTAQELAELKKAQEAQKTQEVATKQAAGEALNPEEQARVVRDELKKYGVMFQDEFVPTYANQRAAETLLDEVRSITKDSAADGKPKVSVEDLLGFMDERGIKNPQDAYDIKFKQELREWERKQLDSIKTPGLVTQRASSAGGKQPAPVTVTRDNLQQVLSDHFGGS